MTGLATLPVGGKAIRFAPGRNAMPASSLWKVWAEGSEVYASTRSPGGSPKISVHASGQIHYRLEAKHKQDLAPLMQLGPGPWSHAFELRFLLSDGASHPFGERESLKKKSAYIIPVPDGFLLHTNLLIASASVPTDAPLPAEFMPAGQALWKARLRDGRLAVLVARLLELDAQNRDHIKYLREDLRPTVNFSSMSTGRRYVEVFRLHWSPEGGNVVLAVPMGEEAFRTEQEVQTPDMSSRAVRTFEFDSPESAVGLHAPDGSMVAVVELAEVHRQLDLVKGTPNTMELGQLRLRLEPSNLISGSPFMIAPFRLPCNPMLGGTSPRTWEYLVSARFDGNCLSAEIRQNSVSLQNKNLTTPVNQLGNEEELLMTIPAEALHVSATLNEPSNSATLLGRFTLRNSR